MCISTRYLKKGESQRKWFAINFLKLRFNCRAAHVLWETEGRRKKTLSSFLLGFRVSPFLSLSLSLSLFLCMPVVAVICLSRKAKGEREGKEEGFLYRGNFELFYLRRSRRVLEWKVLFVLLLLSLLGWLLFLVPHYYCKAHCVGVNEQSCHIFGSTLFLFFCEGRSRVFDVWCRILLPPSSVAGRARYINMKIKVNGALDLLTYITLNQNKSNLLNKHAFGIQNKVASRAP